MNESLRAFRESVSRIRAEAASDALPVAAIGTRLRRLDPEFSLEPLGVERLSDALGLVPDLGAIERAPNGHPRFRFGAASEVPHLRGDLWSAVTAFHRPAEQRLFDLETLRPWGSADTTVPREQPERFLPLPDAGASFQIELTRRFAQELPEAARQSIEAALAQTAWRPALLAALDESGHRIAWERARQEAIVGLVLGWAERHGVPADRVLARARPPARQAVAAGPKVDTSPSAARDLIHRLADTLTDEEVLAFPIPAWALLRLRNERP